MSHEPETEPRATRKDLGIWLTIITIGIGLVLNAIKGAAEYGALEQKVSTGIVERTEMKARLLMVEKQYSDFAVLRETVRNMDVKLNEIKQLLEQRNFK
ncbi:MAG: hypothetical protein M3Y08_01270 [Fibrobacterota bacterium]|nr:hypothetical protein [Fibrobacterota bacterium]